MEALVLVMGVVVVGWLLTPRLAHSGRNPRWIRCVNNLKQLGIWVRVYQTDAEGDRPRLPALNEAALYPEWLRAVAGGAPPKVLICPLDASRKEKVETWEALLGPAVRHRGVSYFAGPEAEERRPRQVLFGDRCFEARPPLPGFSYRAPRAVMGEIPTNRAMLTASLAWTRGAAHEGEGGLAMADGSVRRGGDPVLVEVFASGEGPGQRIVQPGEGPE